MLPDNPLDALTRSARRRQPQNTYKDYRACGNQDQAECRGAIIAAARGG